MNDPPTPDKLEDFCLSWQQCFILSKCGCGMTIKKYIEMVVQNQYELG